MIKVNGLMDDLVRPGHDKRGDADYFTRSLRADGVEAERTAL
jgi:hypothetical protein